MLKLLRLTWGTLIVYLGIWWRVMDHASNLQGLPQLSTWMGAVNLYLRNNPLLEVALIVSALALIAYGGRLRKIVLPFFPRSTEDRIEELETNVSGLSSAVSELAQAVERSMKMDSESIEKLWSAHGQECEHQSQNMVEIWNRIRAIEGRLQ